MSHIPNPEPPLAMNVDLSTGSHSTNTGNGLQPANNGGAFLPQGADHVGSTNSIQESMVGYSNGIFPADEGEPCRNPCTNPKPARGVDGKTKSIYSDELEPEGRLKNSETKTGSGSRDVKVWGVTNEAMLVNKASEDVEDISWKGLNRNRNKNIPEPGGIIPISYKLFDVNDGDGGDSNKTSLANEKQPRDVNRVGEKQPAGVIVADGGIDNEMYSYCMPSSSLEGMPNSSMNEEKTNIPNSSLEGEKNSKPNSNSSLEESYSVETRGIARKHPDVDGGWGYVIAIAVFFAAFIQDGPKNSFGILLPNLERDLGSSVTLISFSAGLLDGTWLFFSPLTAKLIKRFGCRPVAFLGGVVTCVSFALCTLSTSIEMFILWYGVMAGIGIGLFNLPTITMVNRYFRKKRGLVLGFVTSGSGVGLLVMSLVVERLIDHYGWRGAYLVVAGFYLQVCLCASVLRPLTRWPPAGVKNLTANDSCNTGRGEEGGGWQNGKEKKISTKYEFDRAQVISPADQTETSRHGTDTPAQAETELEGSAASLVQDPCFVLFCLTAFLIQLTNNIAPIFYPSYAQSMGMGSVQAAKIVSVFGIANTLGRFSTGVLSHLGINNLLLYSLGTTLTGVLYFLIPLYTSYGSLLASAAGQGFFIGVFPPLQSVILVELLGLERLPYALGIMGFCKSVGSIAGPPMSGALYQLVQHYTLPFALAGSLLILANFLHVVLEILRRKKRYRR